MSSDEVLELLREAYNDELETVMNYLANSTALVGPDGQYVAEKLDAEVEDELNHARQLAERLHTLGLNPHGSVEFATSQADLGSVGSVGNDAPELNEVVDGVIEAERDAISTYRELIQSAQEANDYATEDLAVELLRDEEKHLQEFKDLRKRLTD